MGIRLATWSFALVCALALDSACNIKNCEQGSTCHEDGDNTGNEPASNECLDFCARLSFCDHGLPNGFDAWLSTCKQRFEADPQSAAKLCVCAQWSECEDLIAGKCSAHDPSGSGGTSASGGATSGGGTGGTSASGGTSAGGASGGTSASGGSGGTSAGGASGGTSAGGTSAGGASADAGIGCETNCDCPSGQYCLSGTCVSP